MKNLKSAALPKSFASQKWANYNNRKRSQNQQSNKYIPPHRLNKSASQQMLGSKCLQCKCYGTSNRTELEKTTQRDIQKNNKEIKLTVGNGVAKCNRNINRPTEQSTQTKDKQFSISNIENKLPLMPVANVNWADPKLFRAGILPVCDGYIGLSVSSYSSILSTIGGSFEASLDYDLFSTAIREYNEEVGYNLPNVTELDLHKCYAIVSEYSILIFLQIDKIPDKFEPTDEINKIVWVTPQQLITFANNQSLYIKSKTVTVKSQGKVSRALTFSSDLKHYAEDIAYIVHHHKDLRLSHRAPTLIRTKKQSDDRSNEIIYDFDKFNKDFQETSYWLRSPIVITPNMMSIRHHKTGALYIIESIDYPNFINALLAKNKMYFLISCLHDVKHLDPTGKNLKMLKKKIVQVDNCEYRIKEHIKFTALTKTRNFDLQKRLIEEPKVIRMYEELIYVHSKKMGTYFSQKRASFLDAINTVNMRLKNGDNRSVSRIIKDEYKGSDPSPQYICNLIDRMNLQF